MRRTIIPRALPCLLVWACWCAPARAFAAAACPPPARPLSLPLAGVRAADGAGGAGGLPAAAHPAASSRPAEPTDGASAIAEPPSRAMLRELTSSPRLAGTSGAAWSADLVARWLEDAGWKVEIDRREVLLSLPRSIAFTAFDNAFSKKPIIERLDRFDPDAIPPGDLPKCNGWSASGDVRGLVVDAGYGQRVDFERLKSLGVDMRGAIALVRYGHCYRGIKVDLATQYGCSGVLLFDDPAEDGPDRGPVWPEGPWKPDWEAQRGSISRIGRAPGDPSTPGWASGKRGDASVARLAAKELEESLPRIPCIPIGARDAKTILSKLDLVEAKDKEGKSRAERLGPGPVQVHLVVDQPRDLRTIHNVIARLPGTSEQCVIAGAHRDAWVRGANDDGAGTVLMLRAAQRLGERAKTGWKPKSTILVCLWDAEEFGMIGSTEWGEANAAYLARNAIAYVNADTGVSGPHFRGASGTPGLLGTLRDVLQRIPAAPAAQPADASALAGAAAPADAPATAAAKTLWDEWCDSTRSHAPSNAPEPRLSLPGSGSDFAVFLHHLSVPVLQFGFGDSESGQYHTAFDDFAVVDRYIDPGFVGHEIAGQFVAELLAEMSQRGSASFSVAEAAEALALRAREAADDLAPAPATAAGEATGDAAAPGAAAVGADTPGAPAGAAAATAGAASGVATSDAAARSVAATGAAESAAVAADGAASTTAAAGAAAPAGPAHVDVQAEHLARVLRHVADELAQLGAAGAGEARASGATASSARDAADLPARAISFYSMLSLPHGLPGRPWYRNRLWSPGLEDGYGSETFPTLRAAAKESAAALEREADALIQAIQKLRSSVARR